MTYYVASHMVREQRELFLEWIAGEGLEAAEIADNGTFSVHNGRISGERFVTDAQGGKIIHDGVVVTMHFHQTQKNPLPEELV